MTRFPENKMSVLCNKDFYSMENESCDEKKKKKNDELSRVFHDIL